MTGAVYLHYTQAELDRNFDQRGWVPNALEVIARYPVRSAAARAQLAHRTLRYGEGADEVLDFFPARQSSAPLQVFVHGGAWRNFTKDDYSFVAEGLVPLGVHAAVLNFSKLPAARLPDVVRQVRRALEWIYLNAARLDADSGRIFVCGYSSGAMLSAMALTGYGATGRVPARFVRAATLMSGSYFMEPVVLSTRGSYVQLSPQEVLELSPGLMADRLQCPALLVYVEHDTDEFQRQSREFAARLEQAGLLQGLVRLIGLNHFELVEKLADPGHELLAAISRQIGVDSHS